MRRIDDRHAGAVEGFVAFRDATNLDRRVEDARDAEPGEPVAELRARGILLDGNTAGGDKRLLLQIFSECLLGPVFFEFIERKKDEGFGEGNFKALFESLERDQLRRGIIKAER